MPLRSVPAAMLLASLAAAFPAHAAVPDAPIRVVEETMVLPEGMTMAEALASVQEVAAIFQHFQPVIPKVPGLRIDLDKEVVSVEEPTIVQLPVHGNAFGKGIEETARVTVHTAPTPCADGDGVTITLDFEASSYNIERRIDRIEIGACPLEPADGTERMHAVGRMYAGYLPIDPAFNGISETIGAKALQTAFIKQVPAVLDAVSVHLASGDGVAGR